MIEPEYVWILTKGKSGMQTNLQDLAERTLQEIGKFGLCSELNRQYRRIYERLKDFAASRNVDFYSTQLLECFLAEIEQRYKSGVIGHCRRNHLRRASLLLRDYAENGKLEWNANREISRPMPSSQEFLCLYSQYIESLKSGGRSKNTIESARNLVRQFLLFLDDNGFSALSETPPRDRAFLLSTSARHLPTHKYPHRSLPHPLVSRVRRRRRTIAAGSSFALPPK